MSAETSTARPRPTPSSSSHSIRDPVRTLLAKLSNLKDVETDPRIELGRTELLIDEVLKLREGSVVALDKLAGDQVHILVNGRLVARWRSPGAQRQFFA